MRCSHCYNKSEAKSPKRELSDDEWYNIFDRISNLKLEHITFSGGEPLIRKDLLMNLINKLTLTPNTSITIQTNGMMLDDKFLSFISSVPNRVNFQISIDGSNSHEHDTLRNRNGSWIKAINSAVKVVNNNMHLTITHVITKLNNKDIDDIFKLAIIIGADQIGVGAAKPLGRGFEDDGNVILSLEERLNLEDILPNIAKKYEKLIDCNISKESGVSYYKSLLDTNQDWLMIDSTGNVLIYYDLPFSAGNILDKSIKDIWKNVQSASKNEKVRSELFELIKGKDISDNCELLFL